MGLLFPAGGLKDEVTPGLPFPTAAFPGPLSCPGALEGLIPPCGCWRMWEHTGCAAKAVSPLGLSCPLSRCPGGAPAPAASCQLSSASLPPAFRGKPGPWAVPSAPSLGQLAQFCPILPNFAQFCPNFLKPFARGMRQMTEFWDLGEFGAPQGWAAPPCEPLIILQGYTQLLLQIFWGIFSLFPHLCG